MLDEYVVVLDKKAKRAQIKNKIIWGDVFGVLEFLPNNFIDLVFADPPYNINKNLARLSLRKWALKITKSTQSNGLRA